MTKRIILPAILLTGALAVGAIGVTKVSAANTTYPPIVQKIAEKFGLNKDDVMSVFEEVHADRHANMMTIFETKLDQAVKDGKITEDQKQKILDKQEEIQAKMDEWKNLNPDERKAKMKAYRDELQKWAQDNGIKFPFWGLRRGFGRGFKMGYMMRSR
jgi:molecular chaperone DnaK (HSP70)